MSTVEAGDGALWPQKGLPEECFSTIPDNAGWADASTFWEKRERARTWKTELLEMSSCNDTSIQTFASVSMSIAEGELPGLNGQIEQRTITGEQTSGIFIAITNENDDGETTNTLTMDISFMSQYPTNQEEVDGSHVIIITVADDGSILRAGTQAELSELEDDETHINMENEEVKMLLGRMGIQNPWTQRIDMNATMHAWVRNISNVLEGLDATLGDILGHIQLQNAVASGYDSSAALQGWTPGLN